MFESLAGSQFDTSLYNSQRDFLTWIVIIVIVVSVSYFAIVLVSEVYMMVQAGSLKSKKNDGDKGDKAGKKGKKVTRKTLHELDAETTQGEVNPLFRATMKQSMSIEALTDESNGRGAVYGTIQELIAMEKVPSQAQWVLIQDACTEMLVTNKLLLDSVVKSKKAASVASVTDVVNPLNNASTASKRVPISRPKRTFAQIELQVPGSDPEPSFNTSSLAVPSVGSSSQ
jgi:hypothetical protein